MPTLTQSERRSEIASGRPVPQSQPVSAGVSPTRTLLILAAALGAGVAAVAALDRDRVECFTGYLQADAAVLVATRDARLLRPLIEPGATVEPGAVVATLADEGSSEKLSALRDEASRLELELARVSARSDVEVSLRLKEIETEILQTRLQSADYLKQQLQHQVESLALGEFGLAGTGGASQISTSGFEPARLDERANADERLRMLLRQDAARNAAEVHQAQVELCEKRLVELEELKQRLPSDVHRAGGVEEVEARLARVRGEIAQLEANLPEFSLASTAYGTLGTFRRRPGDIVRAGEPIVEVFDGERSFLAVKVPSRHASKFEPGAEVELEFPGGRKRAGRIASVQPEAVPPQETGYLFAGEDAVVPIRIEPCAKLWPAVPVGSAVRVSMREQ